MLPDVIYVGIIFVFSYKHALMCFPINPIPAEYLAYSYY